MQPTDAFALIIDPSATVPTQRLHSSPPTVASGIAVALSINTPLPATAQLQNQTPEFNKENVLQSTATTSVPVPVSATDQKPELKTEAEHPWSVTAKSGHRSKQKGKKSEGKRSTMSSQISAPRTRSNKR